MPRILLVIACLLLLVPTPSHAQEDDKQAILDYINEAYALFAALDSYAITTEQTITQDYYNVGSEDSILNMTIVQNQSGQIIGTTPLTAAISLTQTLDMNMPLYNSYQTTETTAEAVMAGGIYYLRFGANDLGLPTDWVNMNEDSERVPGAELYNIETLANLAGFGIPNLALEPSMIDSITPLPADPLGGQKLRVYELVWNPDTIRETDVFNLAQILSLESVGGNTERFLQDYLAHFTFVQRVWIGVDDHLPHRIETVMEVDSTLSAEAIEGGPIDLTQSINAAYIYSDFNAEFVITAPIEE